MSSSGLVQVDSRHQRGQGLLDWVFVRDRTERTWIDPLPDAELDWLLAATQTRTTSLSAQGAAIAAPLGIVAAAFAAALKHGVPSRLSVPTLLCLALAGAYLTLSVSRLRYRLLTLERPLDRPELLKDEAAAIHEKAVLLQRSIVLLLVGAVGVIAAVVIAVR